jgi:hypothetical protein
MFKLVGAGGLLGFLDAAICIVTIINPVSHFDMRRHAHVVLAPQGYAFLTHSATLDGYVLLDMYW